MDLPKRGRFSGGRNLIVNEETNWEDVSSEQALVASHTVGELESLIRLPLSFFSHESKLRCEVFFMREGSVQPSLVVDPGLLTDEWQFEEIRKQGFSALFVRREDYEREFGSLAERMEVLVEDETLPSEERFSMLQALVSKEVERSFRSTDCRKFVAISQKLGSQIASLVADDQAGPREIYELAQHDTTTFVHATNVAAYAVMLSDAMGFVPEEQREELAMAAMMHDIGKRKVPIEILNKPGRLNSRERQEIERHPQLGYEELVDQEGITFAQLMTVYQHHEWIDGSGYPSQITGDDIHPWARLLAVVDSFDAITAERPYQKGLDHQQALKLLEKRSGIQFDQEILKCWTSLFHHK